MIHEIGAIGPATKRERRRVVLAHETLTAHVGRTEA